MDNQVTAKAIAEYLGVQLIGGDLAVTNVSSYDKAVRGSLAFIKRPDLEEDRDAGALFIVSGSKRMPETTANTYIACDNPRLFFAKAVARFFAKRPVPGIAPTAVIGRNVRIGAEVTIGHYCVIGDDVIIGDKTVFNNNVVVYDGTIIGNNCYIKSGSIIGEDGFGFDFEPDRTPVRIPHMGKVVIHDNVEIGAKCTVVRGAIDDTIVGRNVKVDDHVHIAHNCIIGKNTVITGLAGLSGSVVIGENCWIGAASMIIQKIRIGNNATIGIGAVVTEDVKDNAKVMGLQALPLRELVKFKKATNYP